MSPIFLSDNSSGVHENIIKKIIEVNQGFTFPYGHDPYTEEAERKFADIFNKNVSIFFTLNGTSANIVALSAVLASFEAVICADTTHIHTDECGAFEKFTGAKILTAPNKNGKIYPEQIEKFLLARGNEHHNQPKVITISQTTEMGSVYSLEEIQKLADFAHANNMYLHVDGARLANALAATNSTAEEMISKTSVDILSFGGTKNGLMMGEAVVVLNPDLASNLKYIRKQSMQLISKMRFVAGQFLAYFENDLWLQNARSANSMAQYLKAELEKIQGVEIDGQVEANMLYAIFPQKSIDELFPRNFFYINDATKRKLRFVTSFNTSKENIDDFIAQLKETL